MVAQVVAPDLRSLALVLLASSLGALLSRVSRRVILPTIVVEIVLGILIGPDVLDIAEVDAYLQFLSTIGLALLFFFIGLEVVEQKVPRASVVRGTQGWFLSASIGLCVGVVLQQLGVDTAARVKVLKTAEPPTRQAGKKVKDVAELVAKLKDEAGVI